MTAELAPELRRAYAANIPKYYAFSFVSLLQLWLPIWVLYLRDDQGLSLAQITLMEAMFWLVTVVAEMPTGAIADRWGRKLSLTLGAAGNALAVLVFGFAPNYAWILVSYVIWAVAITLNSGANSAFLHDSLAALGREQDFAKVTGRATSCNIAATIISSLVGAPLAAATDLALPVRVSIVTGLAAVVMALTFREPPGQHQQLRLSYRRILREAGAFTLGNPAMRAMVVVMALFGSTATTTFLFTQPLLAERGIPVEAFGVVLAPIQLIVLTGPLLASWVAARLGEQHAMFVLWGLFAASLVAIGLIGAPWAVALIAVHRWSDRTRMVLMGTAVNRYSPAALRATVASAAAMAAGLFTALAQIPAGLLADATSLRATYAALGLWMGGAGFVALTAWRRADRRASTQAAEAEPATAQA